MSRYGSVNGLIGRFAGFDDVAVYYSGNVFLALFTIVNSALRESVGIVEEIFVKLRQPGIFTPLGQGMQ